MRIDMGVWQFDYCTEELRMQENEKKQLVDAIQQWEKAFVCEDNAVQEVFGKPSLLVRMDYVRSLDDSVSIYEVEERPCGVGMGYQFQPHFWGSFIDLFEKWRTVCGDIGMVISSKRIDTCDDKKWADALKLPIFYSPNVPIDNRMYWVRANPDEVEYHKLIPRSLTTIATEGNKEYGKHLGWWYDIPDDVDQLPWKTGFALKPAQGSRCNVLLINTSKGRQYGGIHTKSRAKRDLLDGKWKYYQGWIQPEVLDFLPDGHFSFRRVFFGWDPVYKEWQCMGGFYTGRPNWQTRLHGATDSVFGPILIP
jgi:hypothetical protein